LTSELPNASDYAQPILAALAALVNPSCRIVLAGHSLGALVAGAICEIVPNRIDRLILLAPANGFAAAPEPIRVKTRADRLTALEQLGVQGVAQARGAALVAESADLGVRLAAIEQMAHMRERGYRQATEMLANGDASQSILISQIRPETIRVACGDLDVITPPKACLRIATALGASYQSLGPVGHLVCFETPEQVNQLLA
jgi:pimeloyl-ACP methyl ester carboxylesterase